MPPRWLRPLWLALVSLLAVSAADLARAEGGDYETTLPLHDDPSSSLVLRAWLPDTAAPARGLLIGCHGLGGDFRDFPDRRQWQELAKAHGFGVVGLYYSNGNPNLDLASGYQTVLDGLAKLGSEWGHEELSEVPVCTYGFSAGGGWAAKFASKQPARTIAFAHNKGQSILGTTAAPDVPGLLSYGSDDTTRISDIQNTFAANRNAMAPWMLMVDWGRGHEEDGSTEPMAILLFDQVIERRLPAAYAPGLPYDLVELTEDSGWLGENDSFIAASRGPDWATVARHSSYAAPVERASWIPNEYVAVVWRAIVSNHAFTLVPGSPANLYDVGDSIPLAGSAAGGETVATITYQRGNVPLTGVLGSPFMATWSGARTAVNGVLALATVDGQPRTSNVVLTVVTGGVGAGGGEEANLDAGPGDDLLNDAGRDAGPPPDADDAGQPGGVPGQKGGDGDEDVGLSDDEERSSSMSGCGCQTRGRSDGTSAAVGITWFGFLLVRRRRRRIARFDRLDH